MSKLLQAIKLADKYGNNGETWIHHGFNIWLAGVSDKAIADDGSHPVLPKISDTKDSNGNLTGNKAINWDVINPDNPTKKDGSVKYVPFTSLVTKEGNTVQMQTGAGLCAIAMNDGTFTEYVHGLGKITDDATLADIKNFLNGMDIKTSDTVQLGTLVKSMFKQDIDTDGVLAQFAAAKTEMVKDGTKKPDAIKQAVSFLAEDKGVKLAKKGGTRNTDKTDIKTMMSDLLTACSGDENWTEQISQAVTTENVTLVRNIANVLIQSSEEQIAI